MPELDRRHFIKLVGLGAGAAATAAQLSAPTGVFGDAAGNLFIAEEEGHRFLGGQIEVYELAEITPGVAHEEQDSQPNGAVWNARQLQGGLICFRPRET